jgi:hypothetical protein
MSRESEFRAKVLGFAATMDTSLRNIRGRGVTLSETIELCQKYLDKKAEDFTEFQFGQYEPEILHEFLVEMRKAHLESTQPKEPVRQVRTRKS